MNTKRLLPYLVLITASMLSACRGPEGKDLWTSSASTGSASSSKGEKYFIDTKESKVIWFGSNALISAGSHTGYANFSKGELIIDQGQLTGGTVEVDMSTLADEKHGSDNGLITHLKSADFFEVEKYPFSAFAITMVTPGDSAITVTGNLTMKGITHAVSFPATFEIRNKIVYASGKLSVDRTKWNVTHSSGTVFTNLKEGIISDTIEFTVKIVAREGC